MPQANETVEISLLIKAETNRAILVTEDGKREVWLPKSQIAIEDRKGASATVHMPEWLYVKSEFVS